MPKKHNARLSVINTKYLPTAGVVLLLLGIVIIFSQLHSSSVLAKATTHQPEPFTELYFSHPEALPTTGRAGQLLPVQFTVHNLEDRNLTYTYDIDFTASNGQTTVLRQQQLTVADGQTVTVTDSAAVPADYSGRAGVSVVLVHHPESIHYWTRIN